MVGHTIAALIVSYLILPLLLLLLENIIALVYGAVFSVLLAVTIVAIIWMLISGAAEGSSADIKIEKKASNKPTVNEDAVRSAKQGELIEKDNCAYVPNGFKLHKVHGIAHDYIESDNGIMTREICGLEQFNNGKFHIYEAETMREIKGHEIPWIN